MANQSEEGLKTAYNLLEKGNPVEAKKILADICEFNLENPEIDFAIWCCSFWIDFFKHLPNLDSYERGERLIFQWKSFENSLLQKKQIFQRAVFAVQNGVFNLALKDFSFQPVDDIQNIVQRAEIYFKLGICQKKLGNYTDSLSYLKKTNLLIQGQSGVIAEMADCYALCGKEKQAKVLFREAFYIDAKKIDLNLLDSALIKCLIEKVKQKGYKGEELQYWVPVFGVLYGVLTVSRELRSQEAGKLKQDIFELEVEIKNPANNIKILKPKLMFHYFRLMDYYVQNNETGSSINDLKLKIKLLDSQIFELYNK